MSFYTFLPPASCYAIIIIPTLLMFRVCVDFFVMTCYFGINLTVLLTYGGQNTDNVKLIETKIRIVN